MIKKVLSIFFICWTTVLLLQFGEILLHPAILWFHQLWLPLFLFATAYYLVLGLPALALILLCMAVLGFEKPSVKGRRYAYSLGLFFLGLIVFLTWALSKIYYEASWVYFFVTTVFLVLLFGLGQWKITKTLMCFLGPALIVVLVVVRVAGHFSFQPDPQKDQPNLLVLVVDTLRKSHTGLGGYFRETTPFLDAMAREAVVFDNALSTSSWTKPAMASFFTARSLVNDRTHIRAYPLQDTRGPSLPEFFFSLGFDTAFFDGNPNTATYYEVGRGYRFVLEPDPPTQFALYEFVLPRLAKYYANLPKRVQHANLQRRLLALASELGLNGLNELFAFSRGEMESVTVKGALAARYQKEIVGLEKNYQELTKAIELPSVWQRKLWSPVSAWLFESILKFSYLTTYGSDGEVVVDHWLKDRELCDRFLGWLDEGRDRKRPFYAHLQLMSPHSPYEGQPPYLLPHFDPDAPVDVESPPAKHLFPSQGAPVLPARELENLVAHYDDAVRNADANTEYVIGNLKKRGLLDNTIVVVLADHGEAFYDHRMYDHMYSLYSELVNIPLFFYWPHKLKHQVVSVPASIIDVFPSLVTLSGHGLELETFDGIEGKSLFALDLKPQEKGFEDRIRWGAVHMLSKPEPMLFLQNVFEKKGKKPEHPELEGLHRMVVRGNHKLVHEIEGETIFGDVAKTERLFLFSLLRPDEPLMPVSLSNTEVSDVYGLFENLPEGVGSIYKPFRN